MAVVVQCFHCNAVMELDEGFRGGVCRCSGCGSLLQVPRGEVEQAKRKARPQTPGIKTTSDALPTAPPVPPELSPRSLRKSATPDEPAAPVDAGGSSSALRQIHQTRPLASVPPDANASNPALAASESPESPATKSPSYTPGDEPAPPASPPGNKLLWIALGLLALLAVVVVMSVLILWSKNEEEHPDTAPVRTPAATAPAER